MTYLTTPAPFADGETVHDTKLNALADGIQAAWTPYTPTWKCLTGSDPVLGNGTLTGRYIAIGNTVHFHLELFTGSITTFGTGFWLFGLPSPLLIASGSGPELCIALCIDSSASAKYLGTTIGAAAAALVVEVGSPMVPADATHPFAWGVSDEVAISGTYEAANR